MSYSKLQRSNIKLHISHSLVNTNKLQKPSSFKKTIWTNQQTNEQTNERTNGVTWSLLGLLIPAKKYWLKTPYAIERFLHDMGCKILPERVMKLSHSFLVKTHPSSLNLEKKLVLKCFVRQIHVLLSYVLFWNICQS